jgi:hypothetical protein
MARPTCGPAQVAATGGMEVKVGSRNRPFCGTGLGDADQVTSVHEFRNGASLDGVGLS